MFAPKLSTRTLAGLAIASFALAACNDNPAAPAEGEMEPPPNAHLTIARTPPPLPPEILEELGDAGELRLGLPSAVTPSAADFSRWRSPIPKSNGFVCRDRFRIEAWTPQMRARWGEITPVLFAAELHRWDAVNRRSVTISVSPWYSNRANYWGVQSSWLNSLTNSTLMVHFVQLAPLLPGWYAVTEWYFQDGAIAWQEATTSNLNVNNGAETYWCWVG